MSDLLLVSNLSKQVAKTEITVNSILQDDMTWEQGESAHFSILSDTVDPIKKTRIRLYQDSNSLHTVQVC